MCLLIKRFFPTNKFPILMGIFTGFNICPPLLLAVTYVFNMRDISKGFVFFFVFFIFSSSYLVPFLFIGYFSRFEKIRWVAQMSAILAGGLFFLIGIEQFFVH
ncbi:MAG: sulfite exporter TauE/SafE family protein [Elusimicrobiota bacterium]